MVVVVFSQLNFLKLRMNLTIVQTAFPVVVVFFVTKRAKHVKKNMAVVGFQPTAPRRPGASDHLGTLAILQKAIPSRSHSIL